MKLFKVVKVIFTVGGVSGHDNMTSCSELEFEKSSPTFQIGIPSGEELTFLQVGISELVGHSVLPLACDYTRSCDRF